MVFPSLLAALLLSPLTVPAAEPGPVAPESAAQKPLLVDFKETPSADQVEEAWKRHRASSGLTEPTGLVHARTPDGDSLWIVSSENGATVLDAWGAIHFTPPMKRRFISVGIASSVISGDLTMTTSFAFGLFLLNDAWDISANLSIPAKNQKVEIIPGAGLRRHFSIGKGWDASLGAQLGYVYGFDRSTDTTQQIRSWTYSGLTGLSYYFSSGMSADGSLAYGNNGGALSLGLTRVF